MRGTISFICGCTVGIELLEDEYDNALCIDLFILRFMFFWEKGENH